MTVKAKFKIEDIYGYVQQQAQRANTAILNAYKFAGEGFVREARLKTALEGGFNDITGNLRSSIGYIILQDGKQLENNFQESAFGSDRGTGLAKGILVAEEIATGFPKGIILVCVAGMEYAAAVESKGKDVITGSSLNLEARLKTLISQI